MELWDVYDKDRVKTGKTMVRGAEFIPYYKSLIQLLFEARKKYGAHVKG